MGLGLFTVAGLAGAVIYIVHHIVVKTTLFLVAGLIEERTGTAELAKLSGLRRLEPVFAVLFILPALSLAGIPPFSGFVAKLALVQAGIATEDYLIVAVSLAVSLLTLFSMTKIWANTFWGVSQEDTVGRTLTASRRMLMVGPTAGLVVLSLAIAVSSGPLFDLSERAARDLVDPSGYVAEVLGR
jgi:multicomponent Na+:H+ antiporter subunit D